MKLRRTTALLAAVLVLAAGCERGPDADPQLDQVEQLLDEDAQPAADED